jgi:wyosine [tRNA(Phe)-imidazoG37] synthetase (radical SAM superfamily)
MQYNHLFGPVQSRRLGRSLGVDMIPFKTCNCNCVYCECGGACAVESERREYIAAEELINELREYLNREAAVDYVTFAGSGEPTLNTALETVVRFVKTTFPACKTALITNGTLFHIAEVRQAAMLFDLVMPSMDAVSAEAFRRVNRPHPGCDVNRMIEGLRDFSKEYRGQLWIEVFIVPGINDSSEEISLLRDALLSIDPDRVQLNSLDRPGACDWVTTATPELLASIAQQFRPLPVEIISRQALAQAAAPLPGSPLADSVLHQLRRRPATIEELSMICGATVNDLAPVIEQLLRENRCTTTTVDGRKYYSLT